MGMPKQTFYYGNRRDFLKSASLLAGAAAVSAPYFLRAQGTNERINIACIGVGGKGDSDSNAAFALGGNIVALCDIDSNTLNAKNKSLQERAAKESRTYDPKLYRDWRKMFDEMGKVLDRGLNCRCELPNLRVPQRRAAVCTLSRLHQH
jgi:hypothetical protein